jgi:hypothetical protein
VLSQLLQVFQLAGAGFISLLLSVELARRPMVVVGALLGVYAWSLLGELPSTRVAGVGISPIDAVNIIAFGAATIRMRRGPRSWQWALLTVTALILYATLRGAAMLGDAALLGFRADLYFVVPALFVATLPAAMIPRVVRLVTWFGLALAFLAVARWGLVAAGFTWSGLEISSDYAVRRVINSNTTLWVAFAAVFFSVLVLERRRQSGWMQWALAGVTLVVVLLAQHRSVWAATLIMLASAIAVTRRRWFMKAALGGVALFGALAFEVVGLGQTGAIGESLTSAASNTQTWEWRIQRWEDVWATHSARGPEAILVGSGYGYGWVSGVVGVWEVSPHNGYLQVAVRIGVLGAILVFVPYLIAAFRLPVLGGRTHRILWLWTIGALMYYIPYAGTMLTGVVFGAALVLLMERPIFAATSSPLSASTSKQPSAT